MGQERIFTAAAKGENLLGRFFNCSLPRYDPLSLITETSLRRETVCRVLEAEKTGYEPFDQLCKQMREFPFPEILVPARLFRHWYNRAVSLSGEERDGFFERENGLGKATRPVEKPFVIAVEPGIDLLQMEQLTELILGLSPPGSVATIFFGKGKGSFWRKFPVASQFCGATHQMSIPYQGWLQGKVGGVNLLFVATNPNKRCPPQWQEGNSPVEGISQLLFQNVLHLMGHCLELNCWEMLTRIYTLGSFQQLIEATTLKASFLKEWLSCYQRGLVKDSSACLYEGKLMKAAYDLAVVKGLVPLERGELPFWFRGIYLNEILGQKGANRVDKGLVLAGISALGQAWNKDGVDFKGDPFLRFFLEPFSGTHFLAEVATDSTAKYLARKCYSGNFGAGDFFGGNERLEGFSDAYNEAIFNIWRGWVKRNGGRGRGGFAWRESG